MLAPEVAKGRCLLSGAAVCMKSKNASADRLLLSAYGRNPYTVKLLLKPVEVSGAAAMECQKKFLVWKQRGSSSPWRNITSPGDILASFSGFPSLVGPSKKDAENASVSLLVWNYLMFIKAVNCQWFLYYHYHKSWVGRKARRWETLYFTFFPHLVQRNIPPLI